MTFNTVEQSISNSDPAELYDLATPTTTYRVTTYHKNLAFGGHTYTAVAGSRSNLTTADAQDNSTDVNVTIPASHALAQLYVNGVPPRSLLVTITRYHPSSGVFLQMWQGYASGISFAPDQVKGSVATLRVPSATADGLAVDIPSFVASRVCNHFLYNAECTILTSAFQVLCTVASISADGKTITIAGGSIPSPVNGVPWSLHGAVTHIATGESRTIVAEVSATVVTLQAQFPNSAVHVGDSLVLNAGCDHTITQCDSKFANGINFGGHPLLPVSNIFYVGLVNATYHQ